MVGPLKENMLMRLLAQSDIMTKLVLGTLLMMSVFCWAIFFYKVVLFFIKKRQLAEASKYLKKVQNLDDLRTMAAAFSHTLPGYIITRNLSFLKSLLEVKENKVLLSEHELELLQQRIEQTIDDVIHKEESYIPFLSSCAMVSPLLGLFGTVWGLIHAFVSISELQQADIAVVAPGMAEALITTLAGLVVAIPSLIMFHYLYNQVRHLEHQLLDLADKMAWIVQSLFMKR